MKLKYLGTSAAEAFPAPFCECSTCEQARINKGKDLRTRSQAILNEDLIIDFPPDAYMHILQQGINMCKVHTILITHCHEDHLYLHDILLRRPDWLQFDINRQLNVFGNKTLMQKVGEWDNQPFVSLVKKSTNFIHISLFETITAGEYEITALQADHNPNEECIIYYIKHNNTCLLYAHDTGYFPEKTWNWLEGKRIDLMSLDCNNMINDISHNHMGLLCCDRVAQRLHEQGCCDKRTKMVLNHFSHNGGCCHEQFEALAEKYGFMVSWDNMEIDF